MVKTLGFNAVRHTDYILGQKIALKFQRERIRIQISFSYAINIKNKKECHA